MSLRYSSKSVADGINLLRGRCSAQNLEADRRLTPCTVDLYIRPIFGADGAALPVAKHWLLHFKWDHDELTFEANDVEGLLEPRAFPGRPEPLERGTYEVQRLKKDLRVYPKTVLELAKKNKYNGQGYRLFGCNCQHWARELGRLLGIKLPADQVVEGADIAATTTILGGLAIGIGALLGSALSRSNKN
ncbi:uncharacterized protein [Macrobrachium rosenbergii]|uniref:uncharacterized protein n=1 Tax=Macrobrachium rosenbergii TaxID=79674 RepID=UPI0034D7900B